jgi:NitT/TauT family transport system ATP-binding protein
MTVIGHSSALSASTRTGTAGTASRSVIEIDSLSFGYGSKIIVDEVSLNVSEGEFVSLIGPSGCGKSTLLSMLDGMVAPDSGTILVNGKKPVPGDPERAMVFQNFALLPWKTVQANVELGLRYRRPDLSTSQRRDIALHYLSKVGLSAAKDLYPRNLSGGMQQRVGLARAFAVEPTLLLMDEPFGALDAQNAEILREELRQLVAEERRTIVFVTHNLDEAIQLSDRVLLMSASPSRFRDDVHIQLPDYSHNEYVKKYDAYRERLWGHLREEVQKVQKIEQTRTTK